MSTNHSPIHRAMDKAAALLQERLDRSLGPGLSLAVTHREGWIQTRTFGVANADSQAPLTSETLFQIGSITKQFTAVACLRLMEQGRLELHQPVTAYLPWFQVGSESKSPITIHHLLTHTSGMIMMLDSIPSSWAQAWMLRDTELGFEPGAQFAYSNVGYNVLQCVIQSVTGESFDQSLRELVFEPLKMHNSYGAIENRLYGQMAMGHKYSAHDDRPVPRPGRQTVVNWYEVCEGCGSVVTTPTELSIFLRMLLNQGLDDKGSRFLEEETYALMTDAHAVMDGFFEGTNQGYGILIEQSEATNHHRRVLGGGENLGFEAAMYGDLESGVGVILCCNSYDVPWRETRWILDIFNAAIQGEPLPAWPHGDPVDPHWVGEKAAEYVGQYSLGDKTFTVSNCSGKLQFHANGEDCLLEKIWGDCFVVTHPGFAHSMLVFGRDDDGTIVEAFQLDDWYRNERYANQRVYEYPEAWDAFVGRYRAFGYFVNSLKFFVRKGQFICQSFSGYAENVLTDLGNGTFRVGGESSPHRMMFDWHADGKTLRCQASDGAFYRVE